MNVRLWSESEDTGSECDTTGLLQVQTGKLVPIQIF